MLAILKDIHPEVKERFYGCGSPIPPALEGATVLDLGCGSGRDCYVLSKLVGAKGRVIGLDMTDEQLAVARKHQVWHADKFGYANTDFRQGYIEDLKGAGIADNSVDLVISNCVLNLSPDKARVFREIFRVLKPGRRAVFLRRLCRPPHPRTADARSGAARRMPGRRALHRGLPPADGRGRLPRCAHDLKHAAEHEQPRDRRQGGNIKFYSITVRAFKLELEDRCEDHGQVAYYIGTLAEAAARVSTWTIIITSRPASRCWSAATPPT